MYLEFNLSTDGRRILIDANMIDVVRDCSTWDDIHLNPSTEIVLNDGSSWYVRDTYSYVKQKVLDGVQS